MLKGVEITEVCAVHFPLKCAEVDRRGARLTPQGSAWIRFYRKEYRDWFMDVKDDTRVCGRTICCKIPETDVQLFNWHHRKESWGKTRCRSHILRPVYTVGMRIKTDEFDEYNHLIWGGIP
jgi:hypothetical protein